jgi:trigger factor
MIKEMAEDLLEQRGQQFARYGVTLDQVLAYQNKTRDEAIEELLSQGEERLKSVLAYREIMEREKIGVQESEIMESINELMASYDENTRAMLQQEPETANQIVNFTANRIINSKLQERLIAIATGNAPDLAALEADDAADDVGDATDAADAADPDATSDAAQAAHASDAETMPADAGSPAEAPARDPERGEQAAGS